MASRKIDLLVLAGIIIFSVVNGYFYHVYLGAVRDYGGYVVSAIAVAKSGVPYDVLSPVSQMSQGILTEFWIPGQPIGYSYYLSLWYKLHGLLGIFWANVPLTILSLSILYTLAKTLGGRGVGIIFLTFFVSHYTTVYFTRQTLSENLMLPLIWLGIYLFVAVVSKTPLRC